MVRINNALEENENRFTKLFAKKNIFYILAILILVLPVIIRAGELKFEDYYFFERASSLDFGKDDLSYSGRDFSYYPLGILITEFFKGFSLAYLIIPFLLGLMSLALMRSIFLDFDEDKNNLYLFSYLMIFSPAFIYCFTNYVKEGFIVTLLLAGIYFFLRKYKIISVLMFFLTCLFGFYSGIIALIILIILSINEKRKYLYYLLSLNAIFYFYYIYMNGLPELLNFNVNNIKNYLFDLGSPYGLSFFLIIAGIFGFRRLWREKYKYYKVYLVLIGFFLLSFLDNKNIIYLGFLITVFGAYGIEFFIKTKWEGEQMKILTILIISLGIVFSGVSHIILSNSFEPGNGLKEVVNSVENETIFSYYSYGIYINYFDNRNVIDSNFHYAPDVNERFIDSETIFSSRRLDKTDEILKKYDVTYILITPWMRKNLWITDEDGLLFVLKYNPLFELVKSKGGYELWKVNREE